MTIALNVRGVKVSPLTCREEFAKRLKLFSVARDMTMQQIVETALVEWIERNDKPKPRFAHNPPSPTADAARRKSEATSRMMEHAGGSEKPFTTSTLSEILESRAKAGKQAVKKGVPELQFNPAHTKSGAQGRSKRS